MDENLAFGLEESCGENICNTIGLIAKSGDKYPLK